MLDIAYVDRHEYCSRTIWNLQLVIARDMACIGAVLMRTTPRVVAGGEVQEPCRTAQQIWIKWKEHLQRPNLQRQLF